LAKASPQAVANVVAELRAYAAQQCVELALAIHHELVVATPVDTGWARDNWIISVGTRAPAIRVRDKGGRFISHRQARATGARAGRGSPQVQAMGLLASYRLEHGPIMVDNRVDYLVYLAEGSSPQADHGWIEEAIGRALAHHGSGGKGHVRVPGGLR